MEKIDLGKSGLHASAISLGLMRMAGMELKDATQVVRTSIDAGIDFFDHADIYGRGESEILFAKAVKEAGIKREEMIIQSKCAIRPMADLGLTTYDFSKEHILGSVDAALERLQTDYLDVLLLHRPDTLMEPEEVAEAFDKLKSTGKVKHFGVSNFTPMQIEFLQNSLDMKLIANQLQVGLMHTTMVDRGVFANRNETFATDRSGDILEYTRLKNITIQAWSPFTSPKGIFIDNPEYKELNDYMTQLAGEYNVSTNAIATAWILRHPAKMQVIIGTMTPERISDIVKADGVKLTREQWYMLYKKAGIVLP